MPTGTVLIASGTTIKGDPTYDVYVNGKKTGTLRRLYKSEQWAYGCEWGYFSDVATDNFQWYSLDQAQTSLENFQPRWC